MIIQDAADVTRREEAVIASPDGAHDPSVAAVLEELVPLVRRRNMASAGHCLRHGISMMHLYLLGVLEDGPLPMSRIAETLDVSVSSATGIVDRMEERGLVERVHHTEDRRIVLVRLTEPGRAALDRVEEAGRTDFERLVERLTPSERRCVLDAARAVNTAFCALHTEAAEGSEAASPASAELCSDDPSPNQDQRP